MAVLGQVYPPIPAAVSWGISDYTLTKGPYIFRSGLYPTLSDGYRFWDAIRLLADSAALGEAEKQRVKALIMENARRWVRWKSQDD